MRLSSTTTFLILVTLVCQPLLLSVETHPHFKIGPKKIYKPRPARAPKKGAIKAAGQIPFNKNGLVLKNMEVIPVYWGTKVRYQAQITQWYNAVVNASANIAYLKEYGILTGKTLPAVIVSSLPKGEITDDTVGTVLQALINKGTIKPNANTYYAIHFPVGATGIGNLEGNDYCAYHTEISLEVKNSKGKYESKNVYYGIMPDFTQGVKFGCDLYGTGVPKTEFSYLAATMYHELVEAASDPDSTYPGWYLEGDKNGGEIADQCDTSKLMTGSDGKKYVVQVSWSNKAKKCV